MRSLIYLILAVSFVLGACKKGSDTVKEQTIQLLINKKWQKTADFYYLNGDNGTPVAHDSYGIIEHTKDDYVVYHSDFTMEWNDNQLPDPNDPNRVYTGTWQISEDGQMLTWQLLSPAVYPPVSREILTITDKEYKTTDTRVTPETSLTYFTTETTVP